MLLKHFADLDDKTYGKINKLSLIQNGSEIKDGYVYIYKKKIIGYVLLINNKIYWIYSYNYLCININNMYFSYFY